MNETPAAIIATSAWLSSLDDPVRVETPGSGGPNLDVILKLFPRPAGEPAFDANVIASSIERLHTSFWTKSTPASRPTRAKAR